MRGPISLAYSVDADDGFMFHALRAGLIDTDGLTFAHQRSDTATLNRLAAQGGADVVAISAAAYPECAAGYQLLPHGASVGRGFGPIVVARQPLTPAALRGARVGIPGPSTTAWLVLRLIEPGALPVQVPIAPFSRAFDAVASGEVDAVLLIHEGRLLFESRGLHQVVDVGAWWTAETGLPLPLGVNVVRRGLGAELVARVSRVVRASIAYALAHRDQLIAVLAAEDRGEKRLSDPALIDEYLSLYANEDTRQMAPDAREAMAVLLGKAAERGLIANPVSADWAP